MIRPDFKHYKLCPFKVSFSSRRNGINASLFGRSLSGNYLIKNQLDRLMFGVCRREYGLGLSKSRLCTSTGGAKSWPERHIKSVPGVYKNH